MAMSTAKDIASNPAGAAEGILELGRRFRKAADIRGYKDRDIRKVLDDVGDYLVRKGYDLQKLVQRIDNPIPETANQWQLYSSKAGSARAAKALATQIKKDIEKINKQVNPDMSTKAAARKINAIYKAGIGKKLEKYREWGAWDTEPRGVAAQVYVDAAKVALGYSVSDYMPELVDDLGW